MAGLILKLRPHEELMINGVVVENGDRKARLRVKTDGAHILRLRDAMKPEDATTPLKRAYYIAQMARSRGSWRTRRLPSWCDTPLRLMAGRAPTRPATRSAPGLRKMSITKSCVISAI